MTETVHNLLQKMVNSFSHLLSLIILLTIDQGVVSHLHYSLFNFFHKL